MPRTPPSPYDAGSGARPTGALGELWAGSDSGSSSTGDAGVGVGSGVGAGAGAQGRGAAISVIVADAHELMRAGLRMIIDSAPDLEVVGEASSGEQVVRLAATHRPDVALVEVGLPGMSGIDVIRRLITDPTNTTNIVMLTTYNHDELVRESFRAGARGYLMKTAPPSMVLDAIRTAAAPGGGSVLSPEIAQRLVDDTMLAPAAIRTADHDLSTLSEAELRVLRQVARGHTNQEVATRLLVSEATVKSHMTSILRKLGLRDRVQCVIVAYEAGLVAPGRDPITDRQGLGIAR